MWNVFNGKIKTSNNSRDIETWWKSIIISEYFWCLTKNTCGVLSLKGGWKNACVVKHKAFKTSIVTSWKMVHFSSFDDNKSIWGTKINMIPITLDQRTRYLVDCLGGAVVTYATASLEVLCRFDSRVSSNVYANIGFGV